MWFKVDDSYHHHPKTRRLLKARPGKRRDAAAVGLWALAGVWCADTGTDGFVPADELERWDDDWQTLAKMLVEAGYWTEADRDGEHGYEFHDWHIYQPSVKDVLALRAARAEAGRLGGQRSGQSRRTRSKRKANASKQTRTKAEASASSKTETNAQASASRFASSKTEANGLKQTRTPTRPEVPGAEVTDQAEVDDGHPY